MKLSSIGTPGFYNLENLSDYRFYTLVHRLFLCLLLQEILLSSRRSKDLELTTKIVVNLYDFDRMYFVAQKVFATQYQVPNNVRWRTALHALSMHTCLQCTCLLACNAHACVISFYPYSTNILGLCLWLPTSLTSALTTTQCLPRTHFVLL